MMAGAPQFVSAAGLTRNFGLWQDKASASPVIVTSHGRPRVALMAFAEFERLSREAADGGSSGLETAQVAILLDHIPEAFVAFDTQLNFRSLNSVARAYWALPDRDLLGEGLISTFPMLDAGLIVDHLRQVLRSREAATLDAPSHLYPDRMLRFRIFPYPGGIAMLFTDVADQLAEQREAARRVSLRTAGEVHGEVGVGRVTVRGSLTEVGRPFAAIAGSTVATLLGRNLLDLFSSERRTKTRERLDAVLDGKGACAFDDCLVVPGQEKRVRLAFAEIREGFAISGATVLLTVLR